MLNEIRLVVAKFLNLPIIPGYIDFWHIIHFTTGMVLAVIFIRFKVFEHLKRSTTLFLINLLVLYELFEVTFIPAGLFIGESKINILIDILAGIAGFFIALKIYEIKKRK